MGGCSRVFVLLFPVLLGSCQGIFTKNPESERRVDNQLSTQFQEGNCTKKTKIKKFAVYYGIPHLVKEVGKEQCGPSLEEKILCATNIFSGFDFVVLGADLEQEKRKSHGPTKEIIEHASGTRFYGYVNLGNLNKDKFYSIAELQDKIFLIKKMGGQGVFVDEAGFDFWTNGKSTYRERLNAVLDAIHNEGLVALVNAWIPEDIFTSFPEMPAHLQKGDAFILESYIFSSKKFPFQHYRHRVSVCIEAKKKLGISIYGTTVSTDEPSKFTSEKWKYLSLSAHFDGMDAIGWAENEFSATNNLLRVPPNDFLSVVVEENGKHLLDVTNEIQEKPIFISDFIHNFTLSYKNREIKEKIFKIEKKLVECQN